MSERPLLVLGASRYQLEVIQRAKDLGHRVLSADNLPDNPGHALADASFEVDTTDREGILELARREGVGGVVAPGTDVAVPTAAYVAESLGLPGIPLRSARTLTSKIRFREWMSGAGLPTPRFQALAADASIGDLPGPGAFPCILKPEGSSGSKGIFVVGDAREVQERLPTTLGFSPTRTAILEQLIEGAQGTCEGVVVDGRVVFSLLTDRETAPSPFVATTGHFVPSTLGSVARAATLAAVADILAQHVIRSSPFDCDFVVSRDGTPWILELTPRLGGNSLTHLVREATGLDLARVAIELALGIAPTTTARSPRPAAQLILGVRRDGQLTFDAAEVHALCAEPWVRELVIDHPAGEAVAAFVNGRTRVGEATLIASTRPELDARAAELRERLALDAVP